MAPAPHRGGGGGGGGYPARPPPMEAFDELAEALRGGLIERARAGAAAAAARWPTEVRALVDREAAALPEAEREALAERVVLLATGLGPLEPLLADPAVDEVMVNGPGEVYVERGGRIEPTAVRVRRRGRAAARDRAHPRAARAAGGRGLAAVRRAAARRLARERGDPAAVAVGAVPDDPALPPRGVLAARPGGERDARARGGRAAGAVRGGAGVGARERRHRVGQDHHAQRAVGRDPGRRADRDDRGRRRAAAAPAPRGAARGAAGERRGRGR